MTSGSTCALFVLLRTDTTTPLKGFKCVVSTQLCQNRTHGLRRECNALTVYQGSAKVYQFLLDLTSPPWSEYRGVLHAMFFLDGQRIPVQKMEGLGGPCVDRLFLEVREPCHMKDWTAQDFTMLLRFMPPTVGFPKDPCDILGWVSSLGDDVVAEARRRMIGRQLLGDVSCAMCRDSTLFTDLPHHG